jgi:hypothetical protein
MTAMALTWEFAGSGQVDVARNPIQLRHTSYRRDNRLGLRSVAADVAAPLSRTAHAMRQSSHAQYCAPSLGERVISRRTLSLLRQTKQEGATGPRDVSDTSRAGMASLLGLPPPYHSLGGPTVGVGLELRFMIDGQLQLLERVAQENCDVVHAMRRWVR